MKLNIASHFIPQETSVPLALPEALLVAHSSNVGIFRGRHQVKNGIDNQLSSYISGD